MTDIESKALELLNAVEKVMGLYRSKALMLNNPAEVALCRAIEQHEAFRREVSEFALGVREYMACCNVLGWQGECDNFIITKPDPLVEAMADCGVDRFESWADQLRSALKARGLEIREKNDDK